MTEQEMLARIAELENKLARRTPTSRIKVSTKGGVSFYGLGRYPITLYKSQWEILTAALPEIQKFITENDAALSQGKPEVKAEEMATAAV